MEKKKTVPRKARLTDEILVAYMPLVNSIAAMVSGKGLPPNVQFDDLVSDGMMGLMKAWENFDPTRGVKFETYASYRIRGEILDGLKTYNPVPYRVQVMIRDLAHHGVTKEKEAKEIKLLEKKQLSEEEFEAAVTRIRKIVAASALMYLMSLESAGEAVEGVAGEIGPAEELEFSEMRQKLHQSVEKLPELERQVLDLFYQKEMSQKDIAHKLKLSRSKVNRLLGRSIIRLRETLGT